MSSTDWQTIGQAALIIAGFVVSWYHKEQIVKRMKEAPPLTFDVQIIIDRTGITPPRVSVIQKDG